MPALLLGGKMPRRSREEELAIKYFKMSKQEKIKFGYPLSTKLFADRLSVTPEKLYEWQNNWVTKELASRKMELRLEEQETDNSKPLNTDTTLDSDEYLASRQREVDEALVTSCLKGNATSLRTFNQRTGKLVEKQEQKVTIELSADEIARRNLEAERRINEWKDDGRGDGHSVEDVPKQLSVLPD